MENYGFLFDPLIGIISVDIYFFASGFLVAHWYLRDKANKILIKQIQYREKLNELLINIVKRFLRLTPVYIMVLGIMQVNSEWLDKTSQIYMNEKSHEICAKYWWRNLLYINNFFDVDTLCMSWSWYLAVDMQSHVIVLMVLILSTMYFYAAVIISGALLIGSIIFTGYTSYIYEYVPT
ncbi:nose resistant to fluoxetine protein 6 [Solenopsis invicta]|uniref:nose resistant to fluoxetine protein 6 n=1 Tax=Solenopsis invicta TaxID=13686 RepID=UPI00193DAA67|nr:nose resistant to fluoxetine protein 6 [Solenopsis invicta]